MHGLLRTVVLPGVFPVLLCACVGGCVGGERPEHLSQGWAAEDRDWFYYAPQGSRLIPYQWFLALEQPNSEELFRSPDHMDSFRFLMGEESASNPDQLPIGFAADVEADSDEAFALKVSQLEYSLSREEYASAARTASPAEAAKQMKMDAPTRKAADRQAFPEQKKWLGLTCSACHTARIEFDSRAFLVDGGPAQVDFTMFLRSLVTALEETTRNKDGAKFTRFANRVLGEAASEGERTRLHESVVKYSGVIAGLESRSRPTHPYGYARLDAFGILLNEIIGTAMETPENWRTPDAPVSYPHLWQTPDLDWVQWNGAAHSPLARNVGEVLGVFADLRLADVRDIKTTANLESLYELEERIKLLAPPKWPEDRLGRIDVAKAERGKGLYQSAGCISCHTLPPYPTTPAQDPARQLIQVQMTPVQIIGTDSNMAMNFLTRTGVTGPLKPFLGGRDQASAAELLNAAVTAVIMSEFNRIQAPPERRFQMNDRRGPKAPTPAQLASYKARPLAGIWATPPYLHNGSVPSLYELLRSAKDRPSKFQVGSREFDPKHVGFRTDQGGFLFDTSLPGNHNTGHEFADQLSEEDRWALIEYLKTL